MPNQQHERSEGNLHKNASLLDNVFFRQLTTQKKFLQYLSVLTEKGVLIKTERQDICYLCEELRDMAHKK